MGIDMNSAWIVSIDYAIITESWQRPPQSLQKIYNKMIYNFHDCDISVNFF